MITAKEVEEIDKKLNAIYELGSNAEVNEIRRIEYAILTAVREGSKSTDTLYLTDDAIRFVADHGFTVEKAYMWTEKNPVHRIILRK